MAARPRYAVHPSMLSSDFARLAEEAQRMVDYGAEALHMDVMDGHFVPNLTIGPPVIAALRKSTNAPLDCHLMVSEPERWVQPMRKAGANIFTFHIEATDDPVALAREVRAAGMGVGVTMKPKTAVDRVFGLVERNLIDLVLVMTVEPGFGGQKFMEEMIPKISALRTRFPTLDIQVDGGIDTETVVPAAKAGANVFVAGSSIFKAADPRQTIATIRTRAQNAVV